MTVTLPISWDTAADYGPGHDGERREGGAFPTPDGGVSAPELR